MSAVPKMPVNPISLVPASSQYEGDKSKPVKLQYIVICKNPDFDDAVYKNQMEAFQDILDSDKKVEATFWEYIEASDQGRWTEADLEDFKRENMDQILEEHEYRIERK
jgi:hypothetical protein